MFLLNKNQYNKHDFSSSTILYVWLSSLAFISFVSPHFFFSFLSCSLLFLPFLSFSLFCLFPSVLPPFSFPFLSYPSSHSIILSFLSLRISPLLSFIPPSPFSYPSCEISYFSFTLYFSLYSLHRFFLSFFPSSSLGLVFFPFLLSSFLHLYLFFF